MWFAGSGGVDHRILPRYEPEIAILHPSERHEANLGRETEAPIPAYSQKVESVIEPVAGTRERRAAEFQQQTRSEALESALRAAQQLQLPTLDIGLDEIQAIEAQPFHHAVDCRQRHDLLRHCLPALGWLSQMGKAEPEAAPVLQRDGQSMDPSFRTQRHRQHSHVRQSVQPDDGAENGSRIASRLEGVNPAAT